MIQDVTTLIPIRLKCPRCGKVFLSSVLTSTGSIGIYSDLCQRFIGLNPLPYLIHTCPYCTFTGYRDEFARDSFIENRPLLGDQEFGCKKYEFLAARYVNENRNPYEIAKVYHTGMCCTRSSKNPVLRSRFLMLAFEWLLKAFKEGAVPEKEKPVALYLLGEFSRLMGKFDKAIEYYQSVASQKSAEDWLVDLAFKQMKYAKKGDRKLKEL